MESTDDYDVVTRRRPRHDDETPTEPTAQDDDAVDPFGLLSGTEEAQPQTPEARSTQETGSEPRADESTAWLLDQLPDPPEAHQLAGWDPETARSPSQTETTLPGRRFGRAPADATNPAPSAPVQRNPQRSDPSRLDPQPRGNTMRIAIAATEFNYDITSMMLERARAHADVLGAEVSHIVRVPGVYDLPLAAKRLMARGDVDGVVALGCVIEGETDHDDLVIQHAARKLIDISLDSDKPVGLGITGPGMSRLQAMSRIDRAKDAVEAAIRMHRELAAL